MIDVAIVGAGHNGLVAASYLAKAGLKVTVVERRPIAGGACVTEELLPGYRFSTAAYSAGLLRPEIIRDLGLKRHGLRLIAKDPQYFLPYPNGKHMFLWCDRKKSTREIAKFSKRDGSAYLKFCEFWDRFVDLFEPFLLRPPPSLRQLLGRAKREEEQILQTVLFRSVKQFLDELFESDEIKAALATQGIIGTFAGPDSPGTLYVMGHHMLCEINGRKGVWGIPEGGMGSITRALTEAAQGFGAELRLNSEIRRIQVEKGKATGVKLADGKLVKAKIVISNADPKRTFLKLVGPEHFDSDFVRRIHAVKTRSAAVKVNCALSEPPAYSAYSSKGLGPQHRGSVEIAPSIDYLERAWQDALRGRPSKEPWLEVEVPSALDPHVAPPSKHILSIFSQYAPYEANKDDRKNLREEYGDRVIEALSKYAPNVKGNLEYMQVLTPADLEETFHLTDGNIFHTEITPDQLLSSRPMSGLGGYKSPIRNLYLCGAGTHPGGGVLGAPGYNAAHAVLADLKAHKL